MTHQEITDYLDKNPPLTLQEVLDATGVGVHWFRVMIRSRFLPPVLWCVGTPQRLHAGSMGLYHPDTIKWVKELKVKSEEVRTHNATTDAYHLAWLKLVAWKNIKDDKALSTVVKAIDHAAENTKKIPPGKKGRHDKHKNTR